MSAHCRPIQTKCSHPFCAKRATVEVFNTYNSSFGLFCRKHGEERVKELRADEVTVAQSLGRTGGTDA